MQLAFQAAQTITPGTTNKTIAANTYLGGVQTIKGDANLVASNIVSGKSIFGVVGTATSGNDPFANSAPFTYTVNAVSGASYGFAKNSSGYYESQNKGQNNTYAICRVNFNVKSTCDIVFDVINYAESSYDYAIFGNLDSALSLSYSADSSVKQSFKGKQSASVVNVTYSGVTVGNHYIDIKFIKDSSQHSNNDSAQFKVQEQSGLSQETINKILAADEDLVASNIKSGVDIFGVMGTFVGSGADTSVEDSFATRTITSYTNSRVTTIGSYAFYHYDSLTSVIFPKVITIGSSAFDCCSSLTSVNFPVATTIGSSAFHDCDSLTSVSFPKVTTINSNAFRDCDSLTSVSFPVATTIGNEAFYYCSSLTSVIFPKVITIGNKAFDYCYNLTSVNFPVATTIGSSAFHYCYRLTSASFPVATTIGSSAFSQCSGLTSVSFPKVTTIGNYAFECCKNLSKIYLGASTLCTLSHSNAFYSTGITSTTGSVFVPASLLASYKAATNWVYFSNRIFSYAF
jgi:hypothetical protein